MQANGKGFIVILPSLLVQSFLVPTIGNIRCCLGDMKRSFTLAGVSIDYVFLVGGFSSSRMVQDAIISELDGLGCAVKAPSRPDLAVVKGSVMADSCTNVSKERQSDLKFIVLLVVVNMLLGKAIARFQSP